MAHLIASRSMVASSRFVDALAIAVAVAAAGLV